MKDIQHLVQSNRCTVNWCIQKPYCHWCLLLRYYCLIYFMLNSVTVNALFAVKEWMFVLSQQEKGKVILMMDGTFGCVRKSSSGRSVEGPKHASRLFLDQFSVDNFVDSHSGDSKNIQLVMAFSFVTLELSAGYLFALDIVDVENILRDAVLFKEIL